MSATIFFQYLNLHGIDKAVDEQILANREKILRDGVTEDQIEAQYAYVTKGTPKMKLTTQQYKNALSTTQYDRETALSNVTKVGVSGLGKQFLTKLAEEKSKLSGADRPSMTMAAYHPLVNLDGFMLAGPFPPSHLLRTVGVCAVLAAIFAIAAFFCPPLAIIAAFYALEDALGMC